MRFMPFNGYAPGNYMNRCTTCGGMSIGCAKRAYTCLTCAFEGETPVYVFGSNLAGRHKKGAAAVALHQYGAEMGKGDGRQGQSYAIPTKDQLLRTMPLSEILLHVTAFKHYARARSHETFQVTPIGCGLAGYSPAQIAPMFQGTPENCVLPFEFKDIIG